MLDSLNGVQRTQLIEFRKEHSHCAINPNCNSPFGGGVHIVFTPTGIGDIVRLQCGKCGEIRDITDYKSW